MTARIVDGNDLHWANGMEVIESMEPEFRENLGDPTRVADLMGRYWCRTLLRDEATRRIDHMRVDPGYSDLTEAYHDSVEECLVLGGTMTLSAEGDFLPGDYFWRPAGWVHSATSPIGFEALLMMEGYSPSDASGRVSRVVCHDERAGQNATAANLDAAIGPRGYLRRVETRFMPWTPLTDPVPALGSRLRQKTLSTNWRTCAQSILVSVPAGWRGDIWRSPRHRHIVVVEGAIEFDGRLLEPCSLVEVDPSADPPTASSAHGCLLFVKVGAVQ